MPVKSTCPIDSLECCIAFGSKDWSLNHRDAWMYGIVFGWGNAINEVAFKHGWDTDTVARLNLLRKQFAKIKRQNSPFIKRCLQPKEVRQVE